MVSAGSANTIRTPKDWIVPGMWMGSRSQSVRSTTASLPNPHWRLRNLPFLYPSREGQKSRARRGHDLLGPCACADQAFQPSEKERPPRRGPLSVADEERGAAAL